MWYDTSKFGLCRTKRMLRQREGIFMKTAFMIAILSLVPSLLFAGDFAFVQKDSPLQIFGVKSDLKDAYDRVYVINVSDRPILRAQFGWTMSTRTDTERRLLAVGHGPLVDLNLPPLEVSVVQAQGATLSSVTEAMRANKVQHANLELGVVYVKFDDGTEWMYPLSERKEFIEENNPTIIQKITPKTQEFRQRNGLLGKTDSKRCSPVQRQAVQRQEGGSLTFSYQRFMPRALGYLYAIRHPDTASTMVITVRRSSVPFREGDRAITKDVVQ
jgi:hypothetical protein